MFESAAKLRTFVGCLSAAALLSSGCAKSTMAPNVGTIGSTAIVRVDPPEPEYDPEGWPIDRNRQEGEGSTQLRKDGKEESQIEAREAFFEDNPVMPRVVGP